MINIEKQVAYWRDGAEEEWEVAAHLVERGNVRQGLFWAHLALDKSLKAHVCKATRNLAPRIHNLLRLAELAGLVLSQEDAGTLADLNEFQLAGRYPEHRPPTLPAGRGGELMARAEEVFAWLMRQL